MFVWGLYLAGPWGYSQLDACGAVQCLGSNIEPSCLAVPWPEFPLGPIPYVLLFGFCFWVTDSCPCSGGHQQCWESHPF